MHRGNVQVATGKNTDDLLILIDHRDMVQIHCLHYLRRLPVVRIATYGNWRTGHIAVYSHRGSPVY